MAFQLGKRSRKRLARIHPDLRRVVERAIQLSDVDFTVMEGVRTLEKQKRLVEQGASRTLESRHLTGHAVDLGAWVDSEVRWDFGLYLKLAEAVRLAAIELNIPVVWGACWRIINNESDLDDAIATYVARKKRQGKKPLIDGPHFHLCRKHYPATSERNA